MLSILKRLGFGLTCAVIGFVVGAAGLYINMLRSGPQLELWHTAELTEEFTAERADDVRSFDDYRELEDRLFAELEDKIYARTGTGSTYKLVRYSDGSAADPRGREPDWNRSFELATDEPVGGVLLLHGMSDSPYSLRALGEELNQNDYWVLGLRMPGHGTAPSGLLDIGWQDMVAAVRLGMRHLASKVGPESIHVIGYSTGAALAVDHALGVLEGTAAPMPASLVLVSPAIGISPAAAFAEWMARLARLPGLEKLAWTQILPEFDPFRYNSFTSNAGAQVHHLTRAMIRRVEARAESGPIAEFPPTLVLLSTVDATVSVDAVVDDLLEHLAEGNHELVLFDINRKDVIAKLLVADPGPLTARLLGADTLSFAFTLVTNAGPDSAAVVSRHKPPLSAKASTEALESAWPAGVVSLSHVALPFPPDDPLYGRHPPENDDVLFLGEMAVRGERGVHQLPDDWLLRLRHNPFYPFLERRVLDWIDGASDLRR